MIRLARTEKSEAKRLSLHCYCPTWMSCSRLIMSYSGDPSRIGQRAIRSKSGLVWSCQNETVKGGKRQLCYWDAPYEEDKSPFGTCPVCGSPRLRIMTGTVCYLREATGGGNAHLELTVGEIKIELDAWLRLVAPDSIALATATGSLYGLPIRRIALLVQRSHSWVHRDAIPAFVKAWEALPVTDRSPGNDSP